MSRAASLLRGGWVAGGFFRSSLSRSMRRVMSDLAACQRTFSSCERSSLRRVRTDSQSDSAAMRRSAWTSAAIHRSAYFRGHSLTVRTARFTCPATVSQLAPEARNSAARAKRASAGGFWRGGEVGRRRRRASARGEPNPAVRPGYCMRYE